MDTKRLNQQTIPDFRLDDYLSTWIEQFLLDKRVQNLAPGTLIYYRSSLAVFEQFCSTQAVNRISQIDANLIRQFLLWLESKGHNPGGVHGHYRAVKAFVYWWENEEEPENWRNPFKRVKAPKVGQEPLEPADTGAIDAMLHTCSGDSLGIRDKAILLAIMDTGARAAEFVAINLDDFDLTSGVVLIRKGKGRKPRTVFMGKKTRRAVRAWLRVRGMDSGPLWLIQSRERLTYWGLRQILRRRAEQAKVKQPSLHSFRRLFAISMLRNGVDIYSLQNLMGHADLQVLRRYLAQTTEDLQEAHRRGSPVDNSGM